MERNGAVRLFILPVVGVNCCDIWCRMTAISLCVHNLKFGYGTLTLLNMSLPMFWHWFMPV